MVEFLNLNRKYMELSMELHDATTEMISETHLMQLQSIMVTI